MNTSKGLCTIKGTGNRKQRIRFSIYQKLYIPQYMISDRLKFLFFVSCFFYCADPLRLKFDQSEQKKPKFLCLH